MSFAALFIALLLERFFDCSHLRNWKWYSAYQRLVREKLPQKNSAILLAAQVLPLALLVGLVGLILNSFLFGFIKLAFSILIILYCFGPRNLWADAFASVNALSEGDALASEEKLKTTFDVSMTSDPHTLHHRFIDSIFIQANVRVFAILFWYACVGLIGAVSYRLIQQLIPAEGQEDSSPEVTQVARQVKGYLDWLPVRALTLVFALGGHFAQVLNIWRKKLVGGPDTNDALLTECGVAALGYDDESKIPVNGAAEKDTLSLLDRSGGIVLVVVAIMVFLF